MLLRGDPDRKLELCFRLIDIKKSGFFNKLDLHNLVLSILKANGNVTTAIEKEYKVRQNV